MACRAISFHLGGQAEIKSRPGWQKRIKLLKLIIWSWQLTVNLNIGKSCAVCSIDVMKIASEMTEEDWLKQFQAIPNLKWIIYWRKSLGLDGHRSEKDMNTNTTYFMSWIRKIFGREKEAHGKIMDTEINRRFPSKVTERMEVIKKRYKKKVRNGNRN